MMSGLQSNTGSPRSISETLDGNLRQGIFYPELTLGAGGLGANRRAQLQKFFIELIRQRDVPLHIANLWNALYFNYDLDFSGFHTDRIEQKRIPTRTAQARAPSLPIGAFVRVHTEMRCGDLFAEVIYKEGAHPQLDDNTRLVEPALSGAPATITKVADQQVAIVRERFVLDLSAFGTHSNNITPSQYNRLCRRARWLDAHGHLLMEALYKPADAELEDLDYYAHYLLSEHREGLLAFCFNDYEQISDSELREALLRSFDAIREVVTGVSKLGNWRGKYFFLEDEYRKIIANENAVLGGGDMQTIYRGLTRIPTGSTRCYAAIGPRIMELLENNGFTGEDEAAVRGCAYVKAVCHANRYVADKLEVDQRTGISPSGLHLRLDDDWQGGAIWRAEKVQDPKHYSLATVPATIPLHLGYAESRPRQGSDEEIGFLEEQPIAASQTGFRVVLTRGDRELGRLRLSPPAASALAGPLVDVILRHNQVEEHYRVSKREGTSLYGIYYPLDLHPGIVLHCNVESRGSVLRIRTQRIASPIEAADGTRFDHETVVKVFERAIRLLELPSKEKRGVTSLSELINRAFRIRGTRLADGGFALTLPEIATVVLGSTWKPGDMRLIAEAVSAMALEHEGDKYVWRPRVTDRTRSSDRSLLAAYGETCAKGRIDRSVRRHWVPMKLRRYTVNKPSASKRASYPDACKRYGMYGVLPETLPDDCTWVEPYSRGDEDVTTTTQASGPYENGNG